MLRLEIATVIKLVVVASSMIAIDVATLSQALADDAIVPLPRLPHLDLAKVTLGAHLFVDTRLSGSGTSNCTTCHDFLHGGSSEQAFALGADRKPLSMNTLSIFNSEFNYLHNWQGNVEPLSTVIERAIADAHLMAAEWPTVIQRLKEDPRVADGFRQSYPDGVTHANIIDALTVYVRTLTTPNSRFDRYLRGESNVLTAGEIEGYRLFRSYGCISCHQGQNIGGNIRQVFGAVGQPGEYFTQQGAVRAADLGRFLTTHDPADRFVFRVPSLRNVMLTAPYLHDGSATTIEQAIGIMFRYQLGRQPPPHDVPLIVSFLNTLTGDQPKPASAGSSP